VGIAVDILPPRYRAPALIGHGGMGDIYRATDEVLGRTVAVKVLNERFAEDEEPRTRFQREALTAARLSGELNTVTIYDVGEHRGRPFIVMEYLPGGSLESELRKGPVPPGQALTWLEQAGRALDAAHAHGVVHRDVKPANLLLGRDGDVHVGDFGIASTAGLESVTLTGTVLGTAGYLAPEQAQGRPATAASDRYSLGVVAFELLAGSRPFEADSVTAEALGHVRGSVPSLCGRNPELPCELDEVLERALAKDPDARYPTCLDLVADLRAAFARSVPRTEIIVPAAVRPDWRRRWSPWPLAGLGLLALAGGAVALALTVPDGSKETQAGPTTVVRTVTEPEVRTVTAPPQEQQPVFQERTPAQLNDEGYAKMRAGDYEAALPLVEAAVRRLQGSGTLTEAYASYNLAFTRFALGRCDGVLQLVDRSAALQRHRKELERLRKQAEKRCGDGD
jgi:eukaryotic-like serine/threonine-protein kinase